MSELEPEPYRPVSLLAIAGFGLTCIWLLVLGVGTFSALYSHSPLLLLNLVVALLCFGGIVLAVLARYFIRRSEGTRAGASLATWTIFLGAVSGLGYLAYYAALSLAIKQQADTFTRQWFDELRDGKVDAAFSLTIEPDRRPPEHLNPAALTDTLESRFNSESEGRPRGLLTDFRQDTRIRHLLQGGPETTITSLGVLDWDYQKQGFWVRQHYQIHAPEGSWKIVVAVRSRDGENRGGAGARQWHVVWGESGAEAPRLTSLGQRRETWAQSSRQTAEKWLQDLTERKMVPDGKSVRIDSAGFSAPGHLQALLPRYAEEWLRSSAKLYPSQASLTEGIFPLSRTEGNLLRFEHDFELLLPMRPARPKPLNGAAALSQFDFPADMLRFVFALASRPLNRTCRLEGVVVLEADLSASGQEPVWRVTAIRLLHGRELHGMLPPGPWPLFEGWP